MFCLSNIIASNSSGFIIILLFLNANDLFLLLTTSDLECFLVFNSATVFSMGDKELYFDALETKKNKSFIEKLNRIGPVMDP